jgi:hypothetical protein
VSVTPAFPLLGAPPESATLLFTPTFADIGTSRVITLIVNDRVNQQAQCNAEITVLSPCPEGNACDDGNPCTQTDVCHNNVCVGSNPVVCGAIDQCHAAGVCNTATGMCSNPVVADGTSCNDGNACTQTDSCQAGVCTGNNPVTCTASDQCHVAGVCNTATGVCSNPQAPDGTACNDGNACTQTDTCQVGACVGNNPVICTASDQCHVAGTCDPGSGTCSNPNAPDGTACSDGNACTTADTCAAGTCNGGPALSCDDSNPCTVDSCNPASGCVNVAGNAGAICRAAANVCDSAEQCMGTSPSCPPPSDTSAPVLGAGTDQTVVGGCSSAQVTFAKPVAANSGANQCDAGATVDCTPVAGNSYGDHLVTCTATDTSGNVSTQVSFHVDVLEPLALAIQPPLYGDSTPSAPNGGVDNLARLGSAVPVKVLVSACGTPVTPTGAVTLKLAVAKKQSPSDAGTPVTPVFNGIGAANGVLVWDGTQYHYNLDTSGYALTASVPAFYQLVITASYNANPGVVVGRDAIMLDTQ